MFVLTVFIAIIIFEDSTIINLSFQSVIGLSFAIILIWNSILFIFLRQELCWVISAIAMSMLAWDKGYLKILSTASYLMPNISKHLACLLIAVNIFIAPIITGQDKGPFTESGGDITAYADVPAFIKMKGGAAYGFNDYFKTLLDFLKNPELYFSLKHQIDDNSLSCEEALPPKSTYSIYWIINKKVHTSAVFSSFIFPYFEYFATNYAMYFGINAFIYYLILILVYAMLRPFSRSAAVVALAFAIFSHGLISMSYNHYYYQFLSVCMGALLMNLLVLMTPYTTQKLSLLFVPVFVIASWYLFYLAIYAPALCIYAVVNKQRIAGVLALSARRFFSFAWFKPLSLGKIVLIVFYAFVVASLVPFIRLAIVQVFNILHMSNTRLGEAASLVSWKCLSFLYGIASQQHFYPFVEENKLIELSVKCSIVVFIFISCVAIGTIIFQRKKFSDPSLFMLATGSISAIIFQLSISQSFLYTQAKGMQNILPFTYLFLCAPYVLLPQYIKILSFRVSCILPCIYILSIFLLAIPRAYFTTQIALQHDRASVLSGKFFDATQQIKQKVFNPYILFEPRKSSDIYLSGQAFFNSDQLFTRHLYYQTLAEGICIDKYKLFSGFKQRAISVYDLFNMSIKDIDNIVILFYNCNSKVFNTPKIFSSKCNWDYQIISQSDKPLLFALAADYSKYQDVSIESLSSGGGKYLYIRDGGVNVFLPKGNIYQVLSHYTPVNPDNLNHFLSFLSNSVDRQATPVFNIHTNVSSDSVIASADIDCADFSRIIKFPSYNGEYFITVTVDSSVIRTIGD